MKCSNCGSDDLIYDGDGNTICLKCGFTDAGDEGTVPDASDRGDPNDDEEAPVGCFDQLAEY